MIYGLIVTLLGMGIVFVVLVLLQYILKLMEVIFYREKDSKKVVSQVIEAEASAAPKLELDAAVETIDEEELAAVITAAITSCLGRRSNIVVRNIRRVNDITPAWAKTGRNEQMASRF